MTPEDQQAFVEIISEGFAEDEIEVLETFAEHYFGCQARNVPIELPPELQLDLLRRYQGGDEQ